MSLNDREFGDEGETYNVNKPMDAPEGSPDMQQYAENASPRRGGFPPLRFFQKCVYKILPPGGILSSAFNLASSSIGAGILGLPAASNTSGLGMAMIYLVIMTFFTIFSMHILAIVQLKTGINSFEAIARQLFPGGKRAFSYWVAFIRWFHAFGGCVGYVISVGNCLSPIFAEAHRRQPDNKAIAYFNTTSGNRLLVSLIWLCIMFPLVIPKHIDSLRYASAFAVLFMMYFCVIIIVHSCLHGLSKHTKNVYLSGNQFHDVEGEANIYIFRTGNSAVGGLGTFMFSFVTQLNLGETIADMRSEIRTVGNVTLASAIGVMMCSVLYVLVSIFGYLDFGSYALSKNSILLMYNPMEEPEVMLAYVGVLVKLCAAYAVLSIASRNSIYYIIGFQSRYAPGRYHKERKDSRSEVAEEEMEEVTKPKKSSSSLHISTLEVGLEKEDEDTELFIDNIPYWQHLLLVVILAGVKLICGLFIPNINIVFGFAGAISGGCLAFIFPSLFYIYCGDFTPAKAGYFNYYVTYLLLVSGVAGIVFGTGATIFDIVVG
ncbi:Transmembrane amino acid transporter protein/Tryptophan/tyrosine permease family, putative [Angomonas deanei]|uniref:Transmembrane amino acid transporter protein/Tryptophan/tyrosine permease family, putative n=1 Tax=Angomonas deanei TaxID=59799 RepID=A0A7G2C4N7_9TRYP|nr:Transmembrane amino acid transporter protein/Tryptophan/tyrosine permease family, putative [Angomonas deanei]